jgi:hypothetical protein
MLLERTLGLCPSVMYVHCSDKAGMWLMYVECGVHENKAVSETWACAAVGIRTKQPSVRVSYGTSEMQSQSVKSFRVL